MIPCIIKLFHHLILPNVTTTVSTTFYAVLTFPLVLNAVILNIYGLLLVAQSRMGSSNLYPLSVIIIVTSPSGLLLLLDTTSTVFELYDVTPE